MPGNWTATILWGNGRSHLQEPPNVPGTYTGPLSFQVTGHNYQTAGSGFRHRQDPSPQLGDGPDQGAVGIVRRRP